MLILSRRVGEEIVIDGNIRVIVTAIVGNRVRLGIIAPPSVQVDRDEIHARRVDHPAKPDQPSSDDGKSNWLLTSSRAKSPVEMKS